MAIVMLIVMNLAVMGSIYLVLFILGAFFGIHIDTGSTTSLFIFAALFGFGGSFISLLLSKKMAIRGMKVRLIETPKDQFEVWLIETMERLSDDAGFKMPDVGIFNAPPNAFATGWNKNSSLVAVSTGLIELMSKEEIEGVLAHEVAHIKNGDMITMTLMQGVLNTFVIFFARIIANVISKGRGGGMSYFAISFALQIVFSIFSSAILMWFSRYREYKADEGAAALSGVDGIYNALAKLGKIPQEQLRLSGEMKAFGIVGFMQTFFASHPPVEKRLQHLEKLANRY
jgi:heat shock protein HtpX